MVIITTDTFPVAYGRRNQRIIQVLKDIVILIVIFLCKNRTFLEIINCDLVRSDRNFGIYNSRNSKDLIVGYLIVV